MSNEPTPPIPPPSPIAKQAISEFLRTHPDWAAKPKDDLTVLFESFAAKCKTVMALAEPLASDEITTGVIHSAAGRKNFLLALHRLFVEHFHDYNKEELLFLLAWTHANQHSAQFV